MDEISQGKEKEAEERKSQKEEGMGPKAWRWEITICLGGPV